MAPPRGDGPRRRRNPRVVGPFQARWCAAIKVPLVVHDLSVGGCMILSSNKTVPAKRMTLEIDLPSGECITVDAEPLYARANMGFAARFVDMPEATRLRLQHAIAALLSTGAAAP
jgi:hypothetical protein